MVLRGRVSNLAHMQSMHCNPLSSLYPLHFLNVFVNGAEGGLEWKKVQCEARKASFVANGPSDATATTKQLMLPEEKAARASRAGKHVRQNERMAATPAMVEQRHYTQVKRDPVDSAFLSLCWGGVAHM